MRTSVVLSIAAALTAVAVASSNEAAARSGGGGGGNHNGPAPVVRDHRTAPLVRDHRTNAPVIRDHRTVNAGAGGQDKKGFVWVQKNGAVPGHWERARTETKSAPVVRDHRKPAPAPIVRDHRASAGGGGTVTSGPARQSQAKTYSFRPFGIKPVVTIRR